jgi:hypothetical protein
MFVAVTVKEAVAFPGATATEPPTGNSWLLLLRVTLAPCAVGAFRVTVQDVVPLPITAVGEQTRVVTLVEPTSESVADFETEFNVAVMVAV